MARWTIEIDHGRTSVRRGGPSDPTTTVKAHCRFSSTSCRVPAAASDAFLAGELTVRGNLALSLQLDGLFPGQRTTSPARTRVPLQASGLETFYLESRAARCAADRISSMASARPTPSMLPLIPVLSQTIACSRRTCPDMAEPKRTGHAHGATSSANGSSNFCHATCDEPAVLVGNSLGGRTFAAGCARLAR